MPNLSALDASFLSIKRYTDVLSTLQKTAVRLVLGARRRNCVMDLSQLQLVSEAAGRFQHCPRVEMRRRRCILLEMSQVSMVAVSIDWM